MASPRYSPIFGSVALCAAMLSSAGCTATDKPSAASPPDAAPSVAASTQNPCSDAAGTVKQHVKRTEVTAVTVEGQCTTIVVTTALADGDAGIAKQICDTAAEVAYTGDINSIRVLGSSGKELSNGITGMKCLA